MTISTAMLRTVEPAEVAAWLRANGWALAGIQPERAATYLKPSATEGDYTVDLPLNVHFRDYTRRMFEVFQTVSIASGKPSEWVLAEVRASTTDIIRLRVTGPSISQGRVPITLGTRLFDHARKLVLAAACAAHDPRPVYRTRKPRNALDFLRRVMFAPPEAGSFVVTMHAPVAPCIQHPGRLETDLADDMPFERRATLMLATASAAARHAASLNAGAKPFGDAASQGLNANFCDALAGFVDGEETTGLDIRFAWSTSHAIPSNTPTAVHLGAELSPVLHEAARVLRASGTTPDFELEGAVVRLDSDDPSQGGMVVLATSIDKRPRKVQVQMSPGDYATAIRAHKAGQLVRCEGELVREGRGFWLKQAHHLDIIADEDG